MPGAARRITIPTWLVASVAAALLFAGFITLRTWLTSSTETAAQLAFSLHPSDKIELKRKIIAPPPPPPPPAPTPERITQLQTNSQCTCGRKHALQDDGRSDRELHRHTGLQSDPVRLRQGDGA